MQITCTRNNAMESLQIIKLANGTLLRKQNNRSKGLISKQKTKELKQKSAPDLQNLILLIFQAKLGKKKASNKISRT